MNDLWFDPNRWAWLPGTAFGVLAGLWGSAAGLLVSRGKGKPFIMGSGVLLLVVAAGLLAAGMTALVAGQPYLVWFFLALPGFQGLMMLIFLPLVLSRYRQIEGRKIKAEDLSF